MDRHVPLDWEGNVRSEVLLDLVLMLQQQWANKSTRDSTWVETMVITRPPSYNHGKK